MGYATEWFDEAYRKYKKELMRSAWQMLKDKNFAEDIVQETFKQLLLDYDEIRDKTKLRHWLHKTLTNKVLTYNQRAFHDREIGLGPEHEPSAEDAYFDDFMEQMPKGLADHEKQILYLKIEAGYSQKELGKLLGCSPVAAGMRYCRASLKYQRLTGSAPEKRKRPPKQKKPKREEKAEEMCYNLQASTNIEDRRCDDV